MEFLGLGFQLRFCWLQIGVPLAKNANGDVFPRA